MSDVKSGKADGSFSFVIFTVLIGFGAGSDRGWGPVVKAILWNPGSAYAELAL
jgi:hypothetical protein